MNESSIFKYILNATDPPHLDGINRVVSFT